MAYIDGSCALKLDWKPVFELQIFALNTNKTTDTTATTGNDLSPEMKTYYKNKLIKMAEPELVFDQFANKYDVPKNSGLTTEFRRITPLSHSVSDAVLSEGVTPNGQKLDTSAMTVTLGQYGRFVTRSDLLDLTAIDPILAESTEAIASQAGHVLNLVTRNVLIAGSNVMYAPKANGTAISTRATVAADCTMTLNMIRKARLQLRRYDAPRFDGYYVAIVHPDVAMDIRELSGWTDINKYGAPERIYNGEIGMIEGVRFIENTECKVFEDAGASDVNVYATMFVGKGGYGVTNLEGAGLELIVKQQGSAGTEDALNQRSTVGWKAVKAAAIMIPQYVVRVESCSSMEATAIVN
ncbi:MAG: N4-gp56 family major capsid protein [Clostridia bacterium]|nr:N4-gp56 family major capsid protein [Clostridia bacterium]